MLKTFTFSTAGDHHKREKKKGCLVAYSLFYQISGRSLSCWSSSWHWS